MRVVVITGAGDKSFIADTDIDTDEIKDLDADYAQIGHGLTHVANESTRQCTVPVIECVEGYCFGFGMALSPACDLCIGVDTSKYGVPETCTAILAGIRPCVEARSTDEPRRTMKAFLDCKRPRGARRGGNRVCPRLAPSTGEPMKHALWPQALALIALAPAAFAQAAPDFPTRPVRWLVNSTAGGGADLTARAVAVKLSERLGYQVVVDNRPGGAGNIALELLARAPADGYTMALVTTANAINRALLRKMPYDLVKDFTGITQFTSQPYCLSVNPKVPVTTVRELIEYARARPGTLTYGSAGNGSLSHLGGEMLAQMGKFTWIHVPYKGGAQGIADTISGQINSQLTTIIGTWHHMKAGRLRWLAVSSAQRSKVIPELPTIAESGLPGYDVQGWYGIAAPVGTPKGIVDKVQREVVVILQSPEVGGRFAADGSDPVGSTPAAFTALIRAEAERYAALTKQIGMKIE